MSVKRILIVDDEESILSILDSSLKKLGPDCQVVTASDGVAALTYLRQQPFDLVVTDYRLDGMNGLELLEAIHSVRPQTRVILMTAYGSTTVETEAHRLQAYRYLAKPLEINLFRQVVQEALRDLVISRPGILILSDERYRQAHRLLEQLKAEVVASCILLTDTDGRILVWTGNIDRAALEGIASLLGGSIATLQEAGRSLDGDADAVQLAYREGRRENLYALNVAQHLLLILVIDHSPYSSRLGTVWHFARQTALALRETLGDGELAGPEQVFGEAIDQAFDAEIDRLVGSASIIKPTATNQLVIEGSQANEARAVGSVQPGLLNFEEAVAAGLLSSLKRTDGP